jgi:hypothetical protein
MTGFPPIVPQALLTAASAQLLSMASLHWPHHADAISNRLFLQLAMHSRRLSVFPGEWPGVVKRLSMP